MQSITKAETYYYQHDIQKAHQICQWCERVMTLHVDSGNDADVRWCRVRDEDPFNSRVVTVFVATLVELGKKRELYQYAHQLVCR